MGVISRSSLNTLADRMGDLWSHTLVVDDDYLAPGEVDECLAFTLPDVQMAFKLITEFAKDLESDTITDLVSVVGLEEVNANTVMLYFSGFTIEET